MITDYGAKAALAKRIAETPNADKLAALAYLVDSQLPAGSAEKLDFLGTVPALRRWIGPRSVKKPLEFNYRPVLDKFEQSVLLPLDWVNNDKTDQVNRLMSASAIRYKQWPGKLIANLINQGETDLCFDGLAYFATNHVWGNSGTINNRTTFDAVVADAPTANEAASAITLAVATMQGWKDDQGEPVNENMTDLVIVCPTGAIGAAVTQAVNEKSLDTGTGVRTNPVLGLGLKITVLVTPRVTVQRMILINATAGSVPFAFIENKDDFKISMKGAGSDFEHDNDAWEAGIKAVGVAGYGLFADAMSVQFT